MMMGIDDWQLRFEDGFPLLFCEPPIVGLADVTKPAWLNGLRHWDSMTPVSISHWCGTKGFPYESQCGRRKPRRRHARACPRRVCWPLCAWTIRATIRGERPYGLRCLHLDPRRNAHGVCQMLYRHGWSVTL